MADHSQADTLQRIQSALDAARQVFARFTLGAIEAEYKAGHDPVTEADKAVDAVAPGIASRRRRLALRGKRG